MSWDELQGSSGHRSQKSTKGGLPFWPVLEVIEQLTHLSISPISGYLETLVPHSDWFRRYLKLVWLQFGLSREILQILEGFWARNTKSAEGIRVRARQLAPKLCRRFRLSVFTNLRWSFRILILLNTRLSFLRQSKLWIMEQIIF